jgi:hypothetical protein
MLLAHMKLELALLVAIGEKLGGLFFLFLFGQNLAFVSLSSMHRKGQERQRQNANPTPCGWRLVIQDTNFITPNKALSVINQSLAVFSRDLICHLPAECLCLH